MEIEALLHTGGVRFSQFILLLLVEQLFYFLDHLTYISTFSNTFPQVI